MALLGRSRLHPTSHSCPTARLCAVFSPPRWPVGVLFSLLLGSVPSHLQVAWIILSRSAHLCLSCACQKVGGKFSSMAHLSAYKRNSDHVLHSRLLPCVTHGLTDLCARITVPVFQVGELTKVDLFHRLWCGPERVNPGTLDLVVTVLPPIFFFIHKYWDFLWLDIYERV